MKGALAFWSEFLGATVVILAVPLFLAVIVIAWVLDAIRRN
jgi:hypothetical protein